MFRRSLLSTQISRQLGCDQVLRFYLPNIHNTTSPWHQSCLIWLGLAGSFYKRKNLNLWSRCEQVYDKHFGFSDLPFNITPNPRFVYDNPFYREAFATLRYGIEARKGFIVVTGEVGTGKTTLLRAVMHNVESTVHPAFIFNPRLSFSQLMRSILNDLGITESSQDRLTLITKLNNYLIEQFKKDHVVAIRSRPRILSS